MDHVGYPHAPGTLYDCAACELGPCACTEGEQCVSIECEST